MKVKVKLTKDCHTPGYRGSAGDIVTVDLAVARLLEKNGRGLIIDPIKAPRRSVDAETADAPPGGERAVRVSPKNGTPKRKRGKKNATS